MLSGKWVFIRTVVVLSFVLGFLFYIYFAPMLNQYYMLDPLRKTPLSYLVNIGLYPLNQFIDVNMLYREITKNLLACMGNRSYIAIGPSLEYNGTTIVIALLGDNVSINLIAPDVPNIGTLHSLKGYDGIAIHVNKLTGYKKLNDSIEKYWLKIGSTSFLLKAYPVKSRIVLFSADIVLALFNSVKTRRILETGNIITNLVLPDKEVLEKAEKCLMNIDKNLRKRGLGKVELEIKSKTQIYESNKKALFSTAMYQWMLLSATLALIVSFIVSIREGLGLASASSDLIGVLRLYGAPSYILITMGLATGILLYALTIIGALIVLKLVFKVLLSPVVLPPLAYIISSMRLVLLGIFALMLSAVVLGFVVYSRRRSLEELVAGGVA